jgi:hypothetical protein
MRALAACILALGFVAAPAIAATGATGDSDSSSSKSSSTTAASPKAEPAKAAEPSSLELSNEIQQLRDLIESQTAQIQAQNDALKAQQQQMQHLESQLVVSGDGNLITANTLAAAAINPTIGVGMPSSSGSAASGQDKAPAPPTSISYKGITLTPGGFMAAETVWRQKALGADVNTPTFGGTVPFDGASNAHISEFNASGRQSRIAMLVEGKLKDVKIGGYYEMDFLSAGTTSNNNQSNSYTMRQRQFWGQAAFTNGWTFTGGQQWSLITETNHLMDNRTENLPMVIDAQYNVGFSWARQYGFRVTKSLLNNKLALGFAVEEAQATLTVHGQPTVASAGTEVQTCTAVTAGVCTTGAVSVVNQTVTNNFLLGSFGTSGGLYNPLGNYAYNLAPDLVFKAVWEPGFGHYEVFGMLSQFHDRAFPCANLGGTVFPSGVTGVTNTTPPAGCSSVTSAQFAHNSNRTGGGGGANARWALLNKKVDLGVHFFGGDGIGRYGSSGLSDATTRPDGTLALLRNYQALGTLQLHPVPKLDIYFNVGGEFTNRAQYRKPGASTPNEGYGAVSFSNAGCYTETQPITGPAGTNLGVPTGVGGSTGFIPGALGNCTGDIRRVIEGTAGFWYRFYNGPRGRVQAGMQYSNYIRTAFSGVGAASGAFPDRLGVNGQPHADENMFFTSFRYYLP